MRFDINAYDEKTVMLCPTEENAITFLKHLDSLGLKWCSGTSYLEETMYRTYREKTCYVFSQGEFSDLDFFVSERYTVLNFDDFEWGDEPDNLEPEMTFEEMFYGLHIENQATV